MHVWLRILRLSPLHAVLPGSGELKDAQKSLPFGTMFAVILSNIVYIGVAWVLGATCLRDGGQGGLFNDSIIMIRLAVWGPLVIVGIFASTLSSALATLVGAPRILKAVCEDGIFPPLAYFAKGRKSDNEPIRGYALTFVVAVAGILIGDLNAIAPLITNFFLVNRAGLNFACFLASHSRSPGWRPAYKYYNKWVSLVTGLLCIAVMFAISWWQALLTGGLGVALYWYIHKTAPPVNWGAAEIGLEWLNAKNSLLRLSRVQLVHHVKTWRPIILAVPLNLQRDAENLLRLTDQLHEGHGFAFLGDILVGDFMDKRLSQKYLAHRFAAGSVQPLLQGKVDGGDGGDGGEGGKGGDAGAAGPGGANKAHGVSMASVRTTNTRQSAFDLFAPGSPSLRNSTGAIAEEGEADGDDATDNGDVGASNQENEQDASAAPSGQDAADAETKAAMVQVQVGDDDDTGDEMGDMVGPASRMSISRRSSEVMMAQSAPMNSKNVLVETLIASSRLEGVRAMLQMCGVGQMRPNMLLLPLLDAAGYRHDVERERAAEELFAMVLSAVEFEFGIGVLYTPRVDGWGAEFMRGADASAGCWPWGGGGALRASGHADGHATKCQIDCWWLADTGGALLLVSYIHSMWEKWGPNCRCVANPRVFMPCASRTVCGCVVRAVAYTVVHVPSSFASLFARMGVGQTRRAACGCSSTPTKPTA